MAHGICFYDPKWKFWTGSFVDSTHDGAIQECLQLAKQLAAPNPLPANGDLVAVNFVVDKAATQQILGSSTALESKLPSFVDWLEKH